MKTTRHQLDIAAERIGRAQGLLAQTITQLQKYGMTGEAAFIGRTVGSLGEMSMITKQKADAVSQGEKAQEPEFVPGAQEFAKKVEVADLAPAKPEARAQLKPKELKVETETTPEGDVIPAEGEAA